MKLLAIETSCDDTGVSIIEAKGARPKIFGKDFKILAETVSSQEKLHSEYGGVFPSLAKREHQKNIIPILTKVLKKAGLLKPMKPASVRQLADYGEAKPTFAKARARQGKLKRLEKILERNPELLCNLKTFLGEYQKPRIDKLAVTIGPGLEPCLWVGVNFAKALGFYWDLPIAGVNHIEAHIWSGWLTQSKAPTFPAIGLAVSGGNTQLIIIKGVGKYKLIGETRDDAAGECFDKTARILGLGYPGGVEIAKWARKFKDPKYDIHLPRPMIREPNFDFSFSGLKTAVLYDFEKRSKQTQKSPDYIAEMAKEIQNSISEVLISKTMSSVAKYGVESVILGGGVSANLHLSQAFKKECKARKIACFLPGKRYTADNASMIALTALASPKAKIYGYKNIKPKSNLKING
ncbi:MAG: tRNA (adenosine(37)-N6)-threonylcarbamoyltransferase complex transferase subunit TsaD [Candidatus Paceibacterota bacterium]